MKYNIGFIGLGHMGLPMAKNLLKSDLVDKLYAYDLSKQPMEILADMGAIKVTDIIEIAKNCDVIFTMLQTGEQVSKVCLENNGLFNNCKAGLLYIDCSSIDVDTSKKLHTHATNKNIKMLDAPVSGGVKGAEEGTLTIMVGGELNILEQARAILERIGKNIIYAGLPGTGQAAKICNNMILGVSMIAVSEAFNLGKKLGLEPQNLFNIVSKGSGECWSLTKYCPYPNILDNVPSSNNYQAGFTSQMMLKDLKLSQDAATAVNISTPMGAMAKKLYTDFSATNPEQDFSGIINLFID
jgi:3-hydroxyisobutyrate dehydrogenase